MRASIFFLMAIISVSIYSCELDNYDKPNGNVQGKVIDKITGEPFQAKQPDGFRIKFWGEQANESSPIQVWGMPDGKFENALIFQGKYKLIPDEGAFFPPDTARIEIGSKTMVNFEVMPFLAVTDVNVSTSKGAITTNYTIAREENSGKIIIRKTLVSSIPTVSNVVFDFEDSNDLSGTPDKNIVGAKYTDKVTGLTSGQKYYVRVAVQNNNALKRYNYSKIFQVTVP